MSTFISLISVPQQMQFQVFVNWKGSSTSFMRTHKSFIRFGMGFHVCLHILFVFEGFSTNQTYRNRFLFSWRLISLPKKKKKTFSVKYEKLSNGNIFKIKQKMTYFPFYNIEKSIIFRSMPFALMIIILLFLCENSIAEFTVEDVVTVVFQQMILQHQQLYSYCSK